MRFLFTVLILINCLFCIQSQDSISDKLIGQGVWFLYSSRTQEQFSDEILTKVDYFKKDDVSSIYFDADNKLFSIFTKDDSVMMEDLWKIIDDTHFVIVSPTDESSQIMEIIELSQNKLVIRNCLDIEDGTRCLTHTYLSKKEGWPSDEKIDELNAEEVISVDKKTE